MHIVTMDHWCCVWAGPAAWVLAYEAHLVVKIRRVLMYPRLVESNSRSFPLEQILVQSQSDGTTQLASIFPSAPHQQVP